MLLKEIHKTLRGTELKGSEADIFVKTMAGVTHLLQSYMDLKIKEFMPETASKEGLTQWANLLGLPIDDAEELKDFRRRVLKRVRTPPHGGSRADFEELVLCQDDGAPNKEKRIKRAFCFPTTNPSSPNESPGHITISALGEDYKPITGGEEIQSYVAKNAPLSVKVHFATLTEKPVQIEIFTYVVNEEVKIWRKKVEESLTMFFKEHLPGGLSEKMQVLVSEIHNAINKAGPQHYRLNIPTKDVPLGTYEVPRLSIGGIHWIPEELS